MVDETGAVFRGRSWKPRRLTSDPFQSVAGIPSVDGKQLYAVEARGTVPRRFGTTHAHGSLWRFHSQTPSFFVSLGTASG